MVTWTRRLETNRAEVEGAGDEAAQPDPGSWCVAGADGEFACGGLAAGHYRGALHVQGKLQSVAPELNLDGSRAPERVRLRADPSGTIRISVSAQGAVPSAGVAAFACNTQGQTLMAEREGPWFVFDRLPLGEYTVGAGQPPCTADVDVQVKLVRDGQVANVTLPLPRLAEISGQLVDTSGVPVPDAWVGASHFQAVWTVLAPGVPDVMTDADGAFRIPDLMPGRYDVRARGMLATGVARQRVDLAPGSALTLKLVLEAQASTDSSSPALERLATDDMK